MTQVQGSGDVGNVQVRNLAGEAAELLEQAPGAAILQVVPGRVRLVAGGESWELGEADHVQIPPVRHRLESLEDAAVLLTVAPAHSG